ncbi:Sec translocon subunit SecG [Vibrio chagasii]|uniref:preprotein translocase subunit SecG n=1 Tax=Vibrio TaxID=662 RepID=UPI003371F02E|nr:Sec translocon subunit SecG [Vibrio chagasii]
METILTILYLVSAILIVGLVLIQQGKGSEMGASFGAGASNTVFGASGSGNFLTKMTTFSALVFFCLSLILGNMSSNQNVSKWESPVTAETTLSESIPQ